MIIFHYKKKSAINLSKRQRILSLSLSLSLSGWNLGAKHANKEHVVHRTTYYLDVIQGCDTVGGKTDTSFTGHALSQGLWKIRGEVVDVRKGKKGGGNSLPLEYIRERRMKSGTNEARVDCAGEWGAFVTGRIQSEILYRVSGFHLFSARASTSPPLSPPPRLLSPLQSPNLRFSRDFSASSKMKGSLSNLFQRSSLSTETVRFPPIFGLVFFLYFSSSFFLSFFFWTRFVRPGKITRRDFNF